MSEPIISFDESAPKTPSSSIPPWSYAQPPPNTEELRQGLASLINQRQHILAEIDKASETARRWMKQGAWVSVTYKYRDADQREGVDPSLHHLGPVEQVCTGVTFDIKWDTN